VDTLVTAEADGMVRVEGAPCTHVADHDAGRVRLSVTDWGTCGFRDGTQEEGSGFVYPKDAGPNRLYVGGLWAATDTSYVLNRDFDADPEKDFETEQCLVLGQQLDSIAADQSGLAVFDDSGHPRSRGLRITQRSYAWADSVNDDYVVLVYDIRNETGDAIPALWVGLYMDWDLDPDIPTNFNEGRADSSRSLVYMWRTEAGDGARVGVKSLSHHWNLNMSLVNNPTYVWPEAYLKDEDRFRFLTGDDPAYVVHDTPAVDDWSAIAAVGPLGLDAGESVRVGFAVVGGGSEGDLFANADAAQIKWNAFWGGPAEVEESDGRDGPGRVVFSGGTPNPFVERTAIRFALPRASVATLDIYDVSGRRVWSFQDDGLTAGRHEVFWDSRNDAGHPLGSGVYYARLEACGASLTRKLILAR
jgi:hypothetical protein